MPQSPNLYQSAYNHFHANRFIAANRRCREILRENPDDQEALKLLGMIALHTPRDPMFAGLVRLRSTGFDPQGILDVGAYEGNWTRLARQVFPQSKITMFEAQKEKGAPLIEVAKNTGGNIDVQLCLLGRENLPDVPFYRLNTGSGSTGSSIYEELSPFQRDRVTLKMKTLHTALANDSQQYQFLKLDVQGAELDVIQGAGSRLDDLEFILLEASLVPYNRGAPLLGTVIGELEIMGFSLFDFFDSFRWSDNRLIQVDTLFVRQSSPFAAWTAQN